MENFGRKSIFSSAACTAAVTTDASDVLRAQLTRDLSFLLVVSPGSGVTQMYRSDVPVRCTSLRPCSINIFKILKLRDRWAKVDETWHMYSVGLEQNF